MHQRETEQEDPIQVDLNVGANRHGNEIGEHGVGDGAHTCIPAVLCDRVAKREDKDGASEPIREKDMEEPLLSIGSPARIAYGHVCRAVRAVAKQRLLHPKLDKVRVDSGPAGQVRRLAQHVHDHVADRLNFKDLRPGDRECSHGHDDNGDEGRGRGNAGGDRLEEEHQQDDRHADDARRALHHGAEDREEGGRDEGKASLSSFCEKKGNVEHEQVRGSELPCEDVVARSRPFIIPCEEALPARSQHEGGSNKDDGSEGPEQNVDGPLIAIAPCQVVKAKEYRDAVEALYKTVAGTDRREDREHGDANAVGDPSLARAGQAYAPEARDGNSEREQDNEESQPHEASLRDSRPS